MTKLPFKPRLKNINTKASRSFYYGHKNEKKKSLLRQFFFSNFKSNMIILLYIIKQKKSLHGRLTNFFFNDTNVILLCNKKVK
jgi:hypothetical protein